MITYVWLFFGIVLNVISDNKYCNICFGPKIGTLGYVMSEVENGKPFSEVVKAAKDLGYTEPGQIYYKCIPIQ